MLITDMMDAQARNQRTLRGERADRTRRRLLDASVDLLFEVGMPGVTTGQITKRAGIVQSGFYRHFSNVDECLEERARLFERDIAVPLNEAIRTIHETDPFDERRWADMFKKIFSLFLSNPRISTVYLRYRHDPSPMGRQLARGTDRVRADLTANLWVLVSRFGAKGSDFSAVESLAEFMVGATLSAVEGLLMGRYDEPRIVAERLARNVVAASIGELSLVFGIDAARLWRNVTRVVQPKVQ